MRIGMAVERRRWLRCVGAPFHLRDLISTIRRNAAQSRLCLSFVVIFALLTSPVGSYTITTLPFIDFCGELCHCVTHPDLWCMRLRLACLALNAMWGFGRELVRAEVQTLGPAPGL